MRMLEREFDGTPAEIAELRQRIAEQQRPQSTNSGEATTSTAGAGLWTEDKVAEQWNVASGHKEKLYELIEAEDGKVGVAKAQKHLGLKPGPQIAGVLSGITRDARRITGNKDARFVEFSKNGYGYEIPEPLLTMLRK